MGQGLNLSFPRSSSTNVQKARSSQGRRRTLGIEGQGQLECLGPVPMPGRGGQPGFPALEAHCRPDVITTSVGDAASASQPPSVTQTQAWRTPDFAVAFSEVPQFQGKASELECPLTTSSSVLHQKRSHLGSLMPLLPPWWLQQPRTLPRASLFSTPTSFIFTPGAGTPPHSCSVFFAQWAEAKPAWACSAGLTGHCLVTVGPAAHSSLYAPSSSGGLSYR